MKKIFALVGITFLVSSLAASAAETDTSTPPATAHSADSMTSGYHAMGKQAYMSNKVMPSRNPNCSDEALATMPTSHRAACGKTAEGNATAAITTTHGADSMTAGSHMMAGQKNMRMSNTLMPSHNQSCSQEALEKMPPDHRAACGK